MADSTPRATFGMMGEFGSDFPLWYVGNLGRDTIDFHPMMKSELTFWSGYFDNFARLVEGDIVWARSGDAEWYADRGHALALAVAEELGSEFVIELDLSDSAPPTAFRSDTSPGRAEAARSARQLVDAKERTEEGIQSLIDAGAQLRWTGRRPDRD
jgi:hypothetical protein